MVTIGQPNDILSIKQRGIYILLANQYNGTSKPTTDTVDECVSVELIHITTHRLTAFYSLERPRQPLQIHVIFVYYFYLFSRNKYIT